LHIFTGKNQVSEYGRCVSKSIQLQKIIDGKFGSVESMQNLEAIQNAHQHTFPQNLQPLRLTVTESEQANTGRSKVQP